jgi:hypothetical protein
MSYMTAGETPTWAGTHEHKEDATELWDEKQDPEHVGDDYVEAFFEIDKKLVEVGMNAFYVGAPKLMGISVLDYMPDNRGLTIYRDREWCERVMGWEWVERVEKTAEHAFEIGEY